MKKIFFTTLATIILFSCNSQDTLKINIERSWCGKVIIIGQKDIPITNFFTPDQNGVAYVNEEIFLKTFSIKIMRSNIESTESCKELAQGLVSLLDKREIKYFSFFVPCDNELDKDEEYWHQRSSSDALEGKINIMIDEGKIKIQ